MYLWIIACVIAYFVKGLCGFANTLVFTSILSFGTANAGISPIDLLVGFPANIILTWRNRKQLDPKVFIPLAALVLAGCIPGALLLKNGDVRGIKLFFGFVVVFLGGEMLLRDRGKQLKSSRTVLAVIGVAAGVLCGLFGVGALLAAYVSRVTTGSRSFKANISAVFITENIFRIILYSVLHLITPASVRMSLLLLPAALAGLLLGMLAARHCSETRSRRLMATLLVLSGLSLIIKNL